jgi:hypothetical protein
MPQGYCEQCTAEAERVRRHRCFEVDLPNGATMRVHGDPSMSNESLAALQEIGQAAAALLAEQKPKARLCPEHGFPALTCPVCCAEWDEALP